MVSVGQIHEDLVNAHRVAQFVRHVHDQFEHVGAGLDFMQWCVQLTFLPSEFLQHVDEQFDVVRGAPFFFFCMSKST